MRSLEMATARGGLRGRSGWACRTGCPSIRRAISGSPGQQHGHRSASVRQEQRGDLLSPEFRVKQVFADPNWLADNSGDLDLGSTDPTLVDGFVFIASKAGDAYLARQTRLGGVGGQVAHMALCRPARNGGSAWGGADVDGSVLYVNGDDGEPGNAKFSHITARSK